MKDILSITDNAASQIKKIISKADKEVIGVIVGVDKTGCSGYAYKLDYAKDENLVNFEKIESKGVKVFIEPSATMFLIGSEMDYATDKICFKIYYLKILMKKVLAGVASLLMFKYLLNFVLKIIFDSYFIYKIINLENISLAE